MPMLGLKEFEAALKRVATGADSAGRTAVVKAAALAEAEAKRNFEGSHGKGEPHVGGDKPNVVTGTARRSIVHDPVVQYGFGDWATKVGPTVKYGRRLELGYPRQPGAGRGHQTTRPFPYFGPAAKKAREAFPSIAAEQWRRFMH